MDAAKKTYLEQQAADLRGMLLDTIAEAGQGHIGGCLSALDAMTVLYFEVMNVDPKNPRMQGRDRFVLSKGHAGPALYCVLAKRGFFPEEWLKTLNKPHTDLPSHCDMTKTPGIDMTAGSLGQGIGCAVGMAKAAKICGGKERIFVMIGDGESQEGSVWEASMAAAQFSLDNLVVLLDRNRMQVDGMVEDLMGLGDARGKWEAFGFEVIEVDGHDVEAIAAGLDRLTTQNGKPKMLILNTIKGKGVPFVEEAGFCNHSMSITKQQAADYWTSIGQEVRQ